MGVHGVPAPALVQIVIFEAPEGNAPAGVYLKDMPCAKPDWADALRAPRQSSAAKNASCTHLFTHGLGVTQKFLCNCVIRFPLYLQIMPK